MPSFHVTMILADAAQVSENKINLLGGGGYRGPQIGPTAVAMIIRVPWDHHKREADVGASTCR